MTTDIIAVWPVCGECNKRGICDIERVMYLDGELKQFERMLSNGHRWSIAKEADNVLAELMEICVFAGEG